MEEEERQAWADRRKVDEDMEDANWYRRFNRPPQEPFLHNLACCRLSKLLGGYITTKMCRELDQHRMVEGLP